MLFLLLWGTGTQAAEGKCEDIGKELLEGLGAGLHGGFIWSFIWALKYLL